ncbi:hypothetical protein HYW82_04075 [Candidatus Peregrinibacteria bacterium]|nr:hypothetical protein [Candidatus Peregrinibacteria bacterium]
MIDPKILHQKFVQMGRQRNKLMYEMLAILPDIYESEIWKKYAATIEEYAGKLGGIPGSVVRKRLNLEKTLENKPFLKEAIKDVGIHKVYAVANITTPENDEAMADKLKHMSKSAIVTFAKEMRKKKMNKTENDDYTMRLCNTCEAIPEEITIKMDAEMTFLFKKLKQKLGDKINNRDFLKNLLLKLVDEEFPKARPGTNLAEKEKNDEITNTVMVSLSNHDTEKLHGSRNKFGMTRLDKPISRHIPAPKKRQELAKTSGHCAYPNCNHPPENWHHRDRFSQSKSHESVVPLCKNHHEFMHNGLIKNELAEPKTWQIDIKNPVTNNIDLAYRKHWQEALL